MLILFLVAQVAFKRQRHLRRCSWTECSPSPDQKSGGWYPRDDLKGHSPVDEEGVVWAYSIQASWEL